MDQNRTTDQESVSRVLPPKTRILVVAAVAIAGALLSPLGITSAEAALLTTANTAAGPGSLNPPYGGTKCADVDGNNPASGTKVKIYDCHGAPNQQFELNGKAIYALGAQTCLDVVGPNNASIVKDGTPVQIYTCLGDNNQSWHYYNGQIQTSLYNTSGHELCLNAGANGQQLTVVDCSYASRWQIK